MLRHVSLPVWGQAWARTCSPKHWCAWVGLLYCLALPVFGQATEGWEVFARVKFTEKFFKEQDEYYLVPLLDTRIRAHEGRPVKLKGHYIPMEMGKNAIVLSKYPYSSCFFCGGAGPESVAEVVMKDKLPKLKPDQVITVTGILALNDSDVMHMNFILKEAQIINE